MADYTQLKVPDLKKILQERGLVISGNKADLIARLQEDDAKKAGSGGAAGKLDFSPPFQHCVRPTVARAILLLRYERNTDWMS